MIKRQSKVRFASFFCTAEKRQIVFVIRNTKGGNN